MRFSFIFFISLLLLVSAFDFEDQKARKRSYLGCQKRSQKELCKMRGGETGGLGGYAFGSMDKMIPAHLRKFMRLQQKRASGETFYR